MPRALTVVLPLLGCLSILGCDESRDPASPDRFGLLFQDDSGGSGSLSGNLVTLSDSIPVPNAQIQVYFVGPLPPDTIPPDSIPPDTVPPDTIPPDSFPPIDTTAAFPGLADLPPGILALDTIPGDSTPPPPPPACGERGELVARPRSNRQGRFSVEALRPGIYDVRARKGNLRGIVCGVPVRNGQDTGVTIQMSGN
jgi:hypothetical protein